jgi:DNA-binding NtrC family response regulator
MERLVLMAPGPVISKDDFPEDFVFRYAGPTGTSKPADLETVAAPRDVAPPGHIESLKKARERVEKALILQALQMTNGQRTKASELLEIKPRTLRQKMSDYGITFHRKRKKRGKT